MDFFATSIFFIAIRSPVRIASRLFWLNGLFVVRPTQLPITIAD